MLPQIDPLPASKKHPASLDRDQQRRLHEDGFDMAWHIVRTLMGVAKALLVERHQSLKKKFQIVTGRRVGVLLNREGRGCVPDEELDEALSLRLAAGQKLAHLVGEFVQPSTRSLNRQNLSAFGTAHVESLSPENENTFQTAVRQEARYERRSAPQIPVTLPNQHRSHDPLRRPSTSDRGSWEFLH